MAEHQHATDNLRHAVRNSLIDKELTFELRKDALHWRNGKNEIQLPYAVIKQLALISYPSFGDDQYQCTIHRRRGHKVKIRSHHYKGLNLFEDRSHTYAPFVRELCLCVASANDKARFVSGSTTMWIVYLLLVVLMAGVGILLLMALLETVFSVNTASVGGAAGAFVAMSMLGLSIWRMMRKGKGRDFDPEHPPASLVGQ